MRGKPRIDHRLDARVRLQELRDLERGGAVPLHAQRQGLQPAQGEEAVERARDRADGVLQEGELFAELLVVADDGDAADHVGMAVEVFRRRMHDEVEAVFERTLNVGAGEGVVGGEPPSRRLRDAGDRLEVAELEQRIGRRLDPDELRLGPQRRPHRIEIREVDIGDGEPGRAAPHALEQPPRAAVEVVGGDDVRAVVERIEQRRGRGEPGAEGEAGLAALEVGDAALEGHAGRVLRARILVALVDARALLRVGRGGVDRHHHGAGGRIRLLPGMDAAGVEGELVLLDHRSRTRKWLMRSMRVTSPRNFAPSMTSGTRPRRNSGRSSATGASAETVSSRETMTSPTGVWNTWPMASPAATSASRRSLSSTRPTTRSPSSTRPTTRSPSITGSCDTSAARMRAKAEAT